MGSAFC